MAVVEIVVVVEMVGDGDETEWLIVGPYCRPYRSPHLSPSLSSVLTPHKSTRNYSTTRHSSGALSSASLVSICRLSSSRHNHTPAVVSAHHLLQLVPVRVSHA